MSNSPEKPEPQKVVIDMSHAWTEEDKKRSPEKWAEAQQNPVEQKEYPRKFASAREYIKRKISEVAEYDHDFKVETEQDWETTEADLECGNERAVMQRLECCANREHYSKSKKDIVLWRKSIFEISKDTGGGANLMDKDAVGQNLHEEFAKLQNEMNEKLDKNPERYNNDDIKKWDKEILRWYDASNEISYGNFENTLVLLEQQIEDGAESDNLWRGQLEEAGKGKNPSMEHITRTREFINANSKKLATYRRMRDSLYAIELK